MIEASFLAGVIKPKSEDTSTIHRYLMHFDLLQRNRLRLHFWISAFPQLTLLHRDPSPATKASGRKPSEGGARRSGLEESLPKLMRIRNCPPPPIRAGTRPQPCTLPIPTPDPTTSTQSAAIWFAELGCSWVFEERSRLESTAVARMRFLLKSIAIPNSLPGLPNPPGRTGRFPKWPLQPCSTKSSRVSYQ